MRGRRWAGIVPGSLVLASLLLSAPAGAETLQEALRQAYSSNPELAAARARLRQIDEEVPIARSQGRLGIGGSGDYTESVKQSSGSDFLSPRRQIVAAITADLPLYQGGAVRNAVQGAKIRVEAGRAQLRATESSIFTDAVAAYMDVLRDEAIVELNRNQVNVLFTNVQASRDRFEVGDLTRTDVAQSEARHSLALSQLQTAEAQLVATRERYLSIVGRPANALETPPPLPNLPTDPTTAIEIALAENPDLIAARMTADASTRDVGVARASRLPRVSAVAGGNYYNYLNSVDEPAVVDNSDTAATVGVQLTVPFYQGGGPGARVRQAQARVSEALEQTIAVERAVVAQVRSAYASYAAARGVILSSQQAVEANELALEGVRAENSVGTRDVLDVLNAEQELLDSRVQLVSARRNAYVAGFALLAAMGRAEAANLGLDGGALYDPTLNYRRVRNSVFDWSDDAKPVATSSRTTDIPPLPSPALEPLIQDNSLSVPPAGVTNPRF